MATANYFYALGRRKSATARVRLWGSKNKGTFVVNDKDSQDYFGVSKYLYNRLTKPFNVLELNPEDYSVSVRVSGGGHSAQVDAISLGLARVLVEMNEGNRGNLKRADLLGRDPREKERKKFGFKGARKRRQFTKR